ncbi:MAG: ACP S-malonyltransferase [Myxococcales bacterium]|nr:ACP S-malonyltransferase [Myxococcales bacterium]
MTRRVVLVCPGRGSYGREQLGSLTSTPSVREADAMRAALGRPTPTEMDGAAQYSSRVHIAGENASILTAACTLADRDQLDGVEVVAVIGNSMGWYTALIVAGALPLGDGLRLVEAMGQYQAGNVIGGQVLYPLCDDEWRPRPSPEVDALLRNTPNLHKSILLGGQLVLGGDQAAVATALATLPPRRIGHHDAPMLLPLHSAFHTPLLAETAARAAEDLAGLQWRPPAIAMVDGRGAIFRPRSADPAEIAAYTLGHQVVAPYDFTASVRVVLREYAPDALVLLGPGGNLGGPVAQALIAEGWRGRHSKADFIAAQEAHPFVLSMARPEQRSLVTRA